MENYKRVIQAFSYLHQTDSSKMIHPLVMKLMAFAIPTPTQFYARLTTDADLGVAGRKEAKFITAMSSSEGEGGINNLAPSGNDDDNAPEEQEGGDTLVVKDPQIGVNEIGYRFHQVFSSSTSAESVYASTIDSLARRVFYQQEHSALLIEGWSGSGKLTNYRALASMLGGFLTTAVCAENLKRQQEEEEALVAANGVGSRSSSQQPNFTYSIQVRCLRIIADDSIHPTLEVVSLFDGGVAYKIAVNNHGEQPPTLSSCKNHHPKVMLTPHHVTIESDGFIECGGDSEIGERVARVLAAAELMRVRINPAKGVMNPYCLNCDLVTAFRVMKHYYNAKPRRVSDNINSDAATTTCSSITGEVNRPPSKPPAPTPCGEFSFVVLCQSEGSSNIIVGPSINRWMSTLQAHKDNLHQILQQLHAPRGKNTSSVTSFQAATARMHLQSQPLISLLSHQLAGVGPLAVMFVIDPRSSKIVGGRKTLEVAGKFALEVDKGTPSGRATMKSR